MALVIARSHSLGQRRRGCFLHGGRQPLRVSGGDQPVRHWIVWVIEGDLDRCLDIGPEHQVSAGVGLDPASRRVSSASSARQPAMYRCSMLALATRIWSVSTLITIEADAKIAAAISNVATVVPTAHTGPR